MSTNTNSALAIAEWVDETLNETLQQTVDHKSTRVFAVYEASNGFERRLIGAHPDPYSLLMEPAKLPNDVDGKLVAGCFIMTGWMSKVADLDEDGEPIESDDDDDDMERVRVRVIAAVTDHNISTVVRRFGFDGTSDSFADGGQGMFPEAMRTWWNLTKF